MTITPRTLEVLAILAAEPTGLPSRQLAARMGMKSVSMCKHLRRLRKAGLCQPLLNGGPNAAWATVEHLEAAREHWRKAVAAARKPQTAKRQANKDRLKAKIAAGWVPPPPKVLDADGEGEADPVLTVRQSRVPALGARRLMGLGPCSVFAMGVGA